MSEKKMSFVPDSHVCVCDYDIAHDIPKMLFDSLKQEDAKLIFALMARISETSYRRGVQQGLVRAARDSNITEEYARSFRYNVDIDAAPELCHSDANYTSKGMFAMQYRDILRYIGIHTEETIETTDGDKPIIDAKLVF